MAVALRNHLIKTGKIKQLTTTNVKESESVSVNEGNPADDGFDLKLHCPKCYSSNVGMVSGCAEPTCFDCGYSKC